MKPERPVHAEILCVVGARPNLMKIAPLLRAAESPGHRIRLSLLHTGQHYDADMNDQFFTSLGIPAPDFNLGVGSGTHAVQTAEVMRRFEPILEATQPRAVLVVGDVNSTLACALVAAKRCVPVIHLEAGLRSFDRAMPEEINRVLTDQISDLLFTTEKGALANLVREGIDASRVHFVGNVMIDTLRDNLANAVSAELTLTRHGAPAGLTDGGYAVVTLHRPSNVDDTSVLRRLLEVVRKVSDRMPVAFAMHPRTRARMEQAGLQSAVQTSRIVVTPPLGYLEMLGLTRHATLVLTDSGGIQEETTALGVPCLTLRDNTERPVTVEEGTNTVVGTDPIRILRAFEEVLASGGKAGRIPEYWDGCAAHRATAVLRQWLDAGRGGNCGTAAAIAT